MPCTQAPQVTEAASGFAWLPVSWRLEIPEPSPCGLELLALGRQTYGSQSCNSPGGLVWAGMSLRKCGCPVAQRRRPALLGS